MKSKKSIVSTILSIAFLGLLSFVAADEYQWDPHVYSVGKKYPGWVIQLNGDTLHGFIKAEPRVTFNGLGSSNQSFCGFYTNEKDKKPTGKYKATDIKGYKVADKIYHSIGYKGGIATEKGKGFCLLEKEGQIKQYAYYSAKENAAMMRKGDTESYAEFDDRRFTKETVFARADEKPRSLAGFTLKYAKKMSEYVADYPELAQKVANKEKGYGLLSIYKVIEEYNTWYASNH